MKIVKQDKYKIGDKVKILNRKEFEKVYNHDIMWKYAGQIVTVSDFKFDLGVPDKFTDQYFIKEDKGNWKWYPWLIEGKVVYENEPCYYMGRGNGKSGRSIENMPIGYAIEDIKKGQLLEMDARTGFIKPVQPVPMTKRKWTEAEIAEAKDIVYDYLTQNRRISSVSIVQEGKRTAVTVHWTDYPSKTFVAWCCDNDEYNKDIGLMVALCKSELRKLPQWIKGDKA